MSEPVRFKTIIPHFVVLDVVKTAEYYRDVLGFAILGYFLDPPVFAMVKRDDAELHFGKADGNEIKVNDSVRKGLGCDAYIIVSDIVKLHEELIARGANVVDGPVERVYGSIEIVIKDCNGFELVFGD